MPAKLKPISELSKREAARRRMARRLGLANERSFKAWLDRHRNLDPSDPRYLHPNIKESDFAELNRLRQVDKRYKAGAERMLQKKRIVVDEKHLMSNFAFEDRYKESILALLRDPKTSDYRKRQLRKMQRELRAGMNTEPGQMVLPLDWWRRK